MFLSILEVSPGKQKRKHVSSWNALECSVFSFILGTSSSGNTASLPSLLRRGAIVSIPVYDYGKTALWRYKCSFLQKPEKWMPSQLLYFRSYKIAVWFYFSQMWFFHWIFPLFYFFYSRVHLFLRWIQHSLCPKHCSSICHTISQMLNTQGHC